MARLASAEMPVVRAGAAHTDGARRAGHGARRRCRRRRRAGGALLRGLGAGRLRRAGRARGHQRGAAARRARAAGDKVQLLRAESRLVFDHLEAGDIDKSQRAAEALRGGGRRVSSGTPPLAGRAHPGDVRHASRGAPRTRPAAATRRARSRPATSSRSRRALIAWHAAGQVIAFERIEEVEAVTAELERTFKLPTHAKIARAWADFARALLLGRFSDDPVEVDRQLATLPWEIPFFRREPSTLTAAAEPVAVAGNTKLAALLYPGMKAGVHRVGSSGRSGFVCSGPGGAARWRSTLARWGGSTRRSSCSIARSPATNRWASACSSGTRASGRRTTWRCDGGPGTSSGRRPAWPRPTAQPGPRPPASRGPRRARARRAGGSAIAPVPERRTAGRQRRPRREVPGSRSRAKATTGR